MYKFISDLGALAKFKPSSPASIILLNLEKISSACFTSGL
jgi:hypothetical protein